MEWREIAVLAVQWVVKGALDVDALIGANASAEGGGEDESVDDAAVKVVDIVDTFRLQVTLGKGQFLYVAFELAIIWQSLWGNICLVLTVWIFFTCFQEQPAFDKKGFMGYMKKYLKTLTPLVAENRQATFKKDVEAAVKFLLSKLGDFQL